MKASIGVHNYPSLNDGFFVAVKSKIEGVPVQIVVYRFPVQSSKSVS